MRGWLTLSKPQVAALLDAPAHAPGDPTAIEAALDAFDAWAAELAPTQAGAALSLGLSSRWWLVLATPEADSAEAALATARQQWSHYFELDADTLAAQWQATVVWQAGARLVCALPQALVDGLQDIARTHGLRLQALMPWWALGLQQALADAAPTGAEVQRWQWREGPQAGAWVTQAVARRGAQGWQLTELGLGPARPDAGAALARATWPAAPLEGSDSAPAAARVLTCPEASAWLAAEPPGWAEALNRVGPRVRTGFWGWALLALGVVLMLYVADEARLVQEAQAEAQATVQRLQRGERQQNVADQARQREASRQAEAPGAAAPALQGEGWSRAAQLALWLGHPWAETLDGIDGQAHRSGVVLGRFGLDLATLGQRPGALPELQLQAAVRDDAQALQWLQALGPEASLRSREPLAQPFTTPRGTYALRIDAVQRGGRP